MKRRGFTLIELLVVVAIIALLIAILLPSLGKARELSNRSVCAANIRGIGQSMAVYAADAADAYPIIARTGAYSLASGGSGSSNVSLDTALTSMYPASPSASVTQNMWLLVVTGQVAGKQFSCKSDPGNTVTSASAIGGKYQVNFNDGSLADNNRSDFAYSYSFAYMWSQTGAIGSWWRNKTDAGLPLLSDIAPEGGTGTNNTTTTTPTAKTANSFNHQRDGQNVGFGDAHAEFVRRPDVGQSNDNIFTTGSGTPIAIGAAFGGGGVPQIGTGGAQGAYDVCLVPVSNASASTPYTRE